MPIYDLECPDCEAQTERQIPLKELEEPIYCSRCLLFKKEFIQMKRVILKPILTVLPANKRKWGTSLYRKHEKGEVVKKSKMPTFIPGNLTKEVK